MASNDVLDSPFHKVRTIRVAATPAHSLQAVKSARKEMLQNRAQLGEIIKMVGAPQPLPELTPCIQASTREETRVRYLRTKVDEQFKMTEDCLVVTRLLDKQATGTPTRH